MDRIRVCTLRSLQLSMRLSNVQELLFCLVILTCSISCSSLEIVQVILPTLFVDSRVSKDSFAIAVSCVKWRGVSRGCFVYFSSSVQIRICLLEERPRYEWPETPLAGKPDMGQDSLDSF
jgi:hypothetical protein